MHRPAVLAPAFLASWHVAGRHAGGSSFFRPVRAGGAAVRSATKVIIGGMQHCNLTIRRRMGVSERCRSTRATQSGPSSTPASPADRADRPARGRLWTCIRTRCRCRCCNGLAERGLADVSAVEQGHRPAGHQGERRRAERSPAAGQVAVRRRDPAGRDGRGQCAGARRLAAAVPVLHVGRRRGIHQGHRRRGQRRARRLRRRCAGSAARAGLRTAGLARCRRRGPPGPGRPGPGRHRDRQPGRWQGSRRPGQRRSVVVALRARHLRLHASQWHARRCPAEGLLDAAAGRLPDGDRDRGGPVDVRWGAGKDAR